MQSETPEIWKNLKNDFSNLSEKELKAALCRIKHYQTKDVFVLRPEEAKIKDWLGKRTTNPSKVYSWLTRQKKSTYAERYTTKRLEEKWRKLIEIKGELNNLFPEKSAEELRKIIHKIRGSSCPLFHF